MAERTTDGRLLEDWYWQACPKCRGTVSYPPLREHETRLLKCRSCGASLRLNNSKPIEEAMDANPT